KLSAIFPGGSFSVFLSFFVTASRISARFNVYISATSLTLPASINFSTILIPSPTISIAPRETKCSTFRTNCAGQAALTQYHATSPSKRSTGCPQAGQFTGGLYFFVL